MHNSTVFAYESLRYFRVDLFKKFYMVIIVSYLIPLLCLDFCISSFFRWQMSVQNNLMKKFEIVSSFLQSIKLAFTISIITLRWYTFNTFLKFLK